MTILITLAELKQDYLNYLQAQNSAINTVNPNTYWQIQAGALGAEFLDLYGNLQLIENAIYPQNAVGPQVDQWLFTRGLSARGGKTFGTINCFVTSTTPVTIPINTVFSDASNGNQYQTLQALTVPNGSTLITLYAIQAGSNYLEPFHATLTNGTTVLQVQSSVNGQNEESDQNAITRILQSVRAPQGNVRTTDYQEFVLQTNTIDPTDGLTDSVVIQSVEQINDVGILGVYAFVGTSITEYQLNQGLLPATSFVGYTRQAGSGVITDVNNYIQNQRLVGLGVIVGTTITYLVTSSLNQAAIVVALVTGYSLSTILTINSQDINGNPIVIQLTVEQLIQREFRRAICNQPFGGTIINTFNYITIESIISALNFQLSVLNGAIVQILNDVTITNPAANIATPLPTDTVNYINYTFDIDAYTNVLVTVGS
jgi:hypothetical protein